MSGFTVGAPTATPSGEDVDFIDPGNAGYVNAGNAESIGEYVDASTLTFGTNAANSGTITFSGETGYGNTGLLDGKLNPTNSGTPPWLSNSAQDLANYFSADPGGFITFSFDSTQNYLGLLWGSVDTYNTLAFYNGNTLVYTLTGSEVASAGHVSTGNIGAGGSVYVNITVPGGFTSVVATSTSPAFEFTEVSFANNATPAGTATTLEVSGLLTASAPAVVTEQTGVSTAIAGVSIAQSGNSGAVYTVNLTDARGLLSATGSGISGAGTTALTVTGTLAQVNAELATLNVTEATSSSDAITITATDGLDDTGNASVQTSGVSLAVTPVSETPLSYAVNLIDLTNAGTGVYVTGNTLDFGTNPANAGIITFAGNTGSAGDAGVYSTSQYRQAPYINETTHDAGNYLAAAPNGNITISFDSVQNYFGLLWGSDDTTNSLVFYNGSTVVYTLTGSAMAQAGGGTANTNLGPGGSFYVNVTIAGGYTSVVAVSTTLALEFADVSYSNAATISAGSPTTVDVAPNSQNPNVVSAGQTLAVTSTIVTGYAVYGELDVSGSGVSESSIVYGGGREVVSTGGTGSDSFVSSGGVVIASGGTLSGVVIQSGGAEVLRSGGIERQDTIFGGGKLSVSSGGLAAGAILDGGALTVVSGGLASGTQIAQGGSALLRDGGAATGTQVFSGGTESLVESGTDSGAVISSGGVLRVSSGGVSTKAILHGGFEYVSAGGVANLTVISNGGAQFVSGGVVSATKILVGGSEVVRKNGVANAVVVSSGGKESISAGGHSLQSEVYSAGRLYVVSGGTASGSRILNGGRDYVSSGGIDAQSIISSGGMAFIYSGGVLSGSKVLSGATATVSAGGLVEGGLTVSGSVKILGTVVPGQTMTLAGSAAFLTLDNLAGFGATIGGMKAGDVIDLGKSAYSSPTALFTEAASKTSGTLSITNGTHSATLTLLGKYTTGEFILSRDATGGTAVGLT